MIFHGSFSVELQSGMVAVILERFRETLPAESQVPAAVVLRAHPNVEKHDVRMGHP